MLSKLQKKKNAIDKKIETILNQEIKRDFLDLLSKHNSSIIYFQHNSTMGLVSQSLNENKIFVGVPAKINIIDLNTEEEVPMTDKQYYDYKKLYGQKLKSYLYEYLDEYKGEDVETIKTYVQSLKDAANAEAEAELFYE